MDDEEKRKKDQIEFAMAQVDAHGLSVSSVRDGHVMIITKAKLQHLIDIITARGSDRATIFIKHHVPSPQTDN